MVDYIVSFCHKGGHGSCELTTKTPIDTYKKIREIQDAISKEGHLKDVGITNLILLNKEEPKPESDIDYTLTIIQCLKNAKFERKININEGAYQPVAAMINTAINNIKKT